MAAADATPPPPAPAHPLARLRPLAACALAALAAVLACALDCNARRARRAADDPVRRAAARAAGPELALHSASRWLRHPTRSEPWAASADGPALLDLDPAGALAPPPAAVVRAGLAPVRVRVVTGAGAPPPPAGAP